MRYLLLFLLLPSIASATVYDYSGRMGASVLRYLPGDQHHDGYLGRFDLTIDTDLDALVLDVRADDPAQFDIHAFYSLPNNIVGLYGGGPLELNPDTGEFRLKAALEHSVVGTLDGKPFDSLAALGEPFLQELDGQFAGNEWIGILDGIVCEINFGGPATVSIHQGSRDADVPEPLTAALLGLAGPWLLTRLRQQPRPQC